ncbi:MAG: TlpA disulfide reductase family protein, partial [Anaerolineae bacterium]
NQVSLSDFRGQVVMLNFWASWCGPCRIEIPHMIELYQEKRDQNFEIVAVNLRENPNRVEDFAQELKMPFPVLLDQKGRVGAAYYVQGIPTSVFIDEEGVIRDVHVGTLTESALQRYVNDLLS